MSISRLDIISRARLMLRTQATEPFTVTTTNDVLFALFNDMAREWGRRTESLSAQTVIDIVGGQATYQITAGTSPLIPKAFKFRRVRWRTAAGTLLRELPEIPLEQLPASWEIYAGMPVRWACRGTSQLILYKTPASSITSGLVIETLNLPSDIGEVGGTGVAVTVATNTAPIVITAAAHGLKTGQRITISGAAVNTAANGDWTVTVLTANTFSLNGSTGNGAGTTGTVSGDNTVLEFPDSHREGLIAGMARWMAMATIENASSAARFNFFDSQWEKQIAVVADFEADPSSKPTAFAGDLQGGGRGGEGGWGRGLTGFDSINSRVYDSVQRR